METHPIKFHSDFSNECLLHMSSNGFPFDGPLNSDGLLHRFSRDSKKNQPDE